MAGYTTEQIRTALVKVFPDDGKLTIFCYDHYREVFDSFSSGMTKLAKIQLLIQHCDSHDSLAGLVDQIIKINPSAFASLPDETTPSPSTAGAGTTPQIIYNITQNITDNSGTVIGSMTQPTTGNIPSESPSSKG